MKILTSPSQGRFRQLFFASLIFITAILPSKAATSVDAVYYAQTHVQKANDLYPTLVGNRDTFIKAHVVDPATPASPAVVAILRLGGNTMNLPLSGPATLPAFIADGPGVVQHEADQEKTFSGDIPVAWVKPGLTVEVTAGAASSGIQTLDIGAPTKVIMTMKDIHFFELKPGDYPTGWDLELEAKWPVSELVIDRAEDVVFPELVIPPRDGKPAARVTSKDDYVAQTGINFDGENGAATAWNAAIRRAAGRTTGYSLHYLNKYNVSNEGVAGGFSGVGTGTIRSAGILHHELGHALSLPHWGNNSSYPYKGAMYNIDPPSIVNGTHAGPTWGYDLPTQSFLPATVQAINAGNKTPGTYKADPMQGGGTGFQEPGYIFNHFSDFSVNKMRRYLESVVVVWNSTLNEYATWNSTTKDYTNIKTNNGVKYPLLRDQQVISIISSVSGASPEVCMVYPPIGPYTAGLIRLFDASNATDRLDAQSIFAPPGGCDVCLRVTQNGVVTTYMLAASYDPTANPLNGNSLVTEGINLPASDGTVTRVELLLTPDMEEYTPANPGDTEVYLANAPILYTWAIASAPGTAEATFDVVPTTVDSTSITMTATTVIGDSDFNRQVEYFFTETSGNLGGSSSGWQSSPVYTDVDLQPDTQYTYTVTVRSRISLATSLPSAEFSATTDFSLATETVLQSGGDDSWHTGSWTAGIPLDTIDARIAAGVAGRISRAPLTWTGLLRLDPGSSLRIDEGSQSLLDDITMLTLNDATIHNTFGVVRNFDGFTWVFPPITLINGGTISDLGSNNSRLDLFNFDNVITGNGGFNISADTLIYYNFNTTHTFTGGLTINSGSRHIIGLNAPGAAGDGDVTVFKNAANEQSGVIRLGSNDVFSTSATLSLNGKGWNNTTGFTYRVSTTLIDMKGFNATVRRLVIDGVEQPPGDYTQITKPPGAKTGDWLRSTTGILTVTGAPIIVDPTYASWIASHNLAGGEAGFGEDADNDGIKNGIEYYFGTDPNEFSLGLQVNEKAGNVITLSHPINSDVGADVTAVYRWSEDLATHYDDGDDNGNGISVDFVQGTPANGMVEVIATVTGAVPDKLFFSIKVTENP